MRQASQAPVADLVHRAAEALTVKGFPSQPRAAESGLADEAEASEDRRRSELQRSMVCPFGAWYAGRLRVSVAFLAVAPGSTRERTRLHPAKQSLFAQHI